MFKNQADNFTKIPNDLLNALCRINIPGEARRVFDCIVRKTLGWNRKDARITLGDFEAMTGIKKPNIKRAISRLTSINVVIVIRRDNEITPKYCINTDYSKWLGVIHADNALSDLITNVIHADNDALSMLITDTPTESSDSNGFHDPKESIKEKKESTIVRPPLHSLQSIVEKEYPNISKLPSQLTHQESERLYRDYDQDTIIDYLNRMENYKPLRNKCVSVNLTIRNWMNRDNVKKRSAKERVI